jgi:hypothetical protein
VCVSVGGRTIGSVGAEHSGAEGLAPVYRRVLELHDAGVSDEAIAVILDVTLEAVPTLIEIATRKHERAER